MPTWSDAVAEAVRGEDGLWNEWDPNATHEALASMEADGHLDATDCLFREDVATGLPALATRL